MQGLQKENICLEKKKQINLQHDCNRFGESKSKTQANCSN